MSVLTVKFIPQKTWLNCYSSVGFFCLAGKYVNKLVPGKQSCKLCASKDLKLYVDKLGYTELSHNIYYVYNVIMHKVIHSNEKHLRWSILKLALKNMHFIILLPLEQCVYIQFLKIWYHGRNNSFVSCNGWKDLLRFV
jgi:hypothetical protein